MNMISLTVIMVSWLGATPPADTFPYKLSEPDTTYILPAELNEISGISAAGSLVACVQDESGIVFMYDLQKGKVMEMIPFGPGGDYEDVAVAGNSIYVLRSDGLLYEIRNFSDSSAREVKSYFTAVPSKNNEGLYFDSRRSALLIAAKSKSKKGKHGKSHRDVFMFDLIGSKLHKDPFLSLNIQQARDFALKSGIDLPVKYSKKGKNQEKVMKFHTSAIAIHPKTGEMFLISSSDRLLMIYDTSGKIKAIEKLDPLLFGKPEGIAFLEDGTMYISNEGRQGMANVHKFRQQ